ncbi:LPS assembly protein LptD [Catenovulum sp. 2E275]|uniref:LPS-assembly protein LptD n=1 Tax=Catenovulum sp. 2E275 TaxID=2980497 RepID=UPI0021D17E0A|nr:LPS assembly protein LptD [Catenovulum sp. 2E275]MCU4675090.1 LPS assembly protein LptD [Catenovulum sp. 2E275]
MIRILATFIFLFCPPLVAAQLQCYQAVELGDESEHDDVPGLWSSFKTNDQSLMIVSDRTEVGLDSSAQFFGEVSIIQGTNSITADSAQISNDRNTMTASGGIVFSSGGTKVYSESLQAEIDASAVQLNQSKYQLANFLGHGQAEIFRVDQKNKSIELKNADFTNCPPQNAPDWQLISSEIKLSMDEEWGEAWHSRIEVFEVPVLYLPYFSFPLSDKRKSGLLYPSVSTSSQRGFDLTTPYYWNIAENFDLTLSPRMMTERGGQLGTEFRYLQPNYQGEFYMEWMSYDKAFEPDQDSGNNNSKTRSAIRWLHQADVYQSWKSDIDIMLLSDDGYISDLGFQDYSQVDTHVERYIKLYQQHEDWSFDLTVRDFEVFGQHTQPYRTLPEMQFWYGGLVDDEYWSVDLPAEFAWFQSDDSQLTEAFRFHSEPKVTWSIYRPAWEVIAQGSLASTLYVQEKTQNGQLLQDEYEQIGRVLPRFRISGRLILERPLDWFGSAMKQTLEPRAQYLRVPYTDQSNIGLYDTALLQDDYFGLFRENRFSGIDRIPESNQVTLGMTTRLLSDENREKFRFSVGQIFYLKESRTDFVDFKQTTEKGESALAAELDFDIRKTWFLHYGLQFDTQQGETRKSQLTVDYHRNETHLLQLSHRYVKDISGNPIQQLGVTSLWEITPQWQTFASMHQDLKLDRTVEARVGLLYESCCWQLQFGWQTKVKSNLAAIDSQTSVPTDERDSGLMFTFTITGFGQSNNQGLKVLNSGIFGYRTPNFLNQ